MLLTDQSIPAEFAAQMALILSSLPSVPGVPFSARTRRKARLSLRTYSAREQLLAIKSACEIIADYADLPRGSVERSDFIYARVREILSGVFNNLYWAQCNVKTAVTMAATATGVPDPAPPPYGYRVSGNLPTLPTYGAGVLSSGNPAYSGSRSGNYFFDNSLSWRRTVFSLINSLSDRESVPTFVQLLCTMYITGNMRGSRPMASLMMHRKFGLADALPSQDGNSPIPDALSFYWRYPTPSDAAPFYDVIAPRNVVARIYPSPAEIAQGALAETAVSVFPRPMLGRGNNNNDKVDTSLSGDPVVWQLLVPRGFVASGVENQLRAVYNGRHVESNAVGTISMIWSSVDVPGSYEYNVHSIVEISVFGITHRLVDYVVRFNTSPELIEVSGYGSFWTNTQSVRIYQHPLALNYDRIIANYGPVDWQTIVTLATVNVTVSPDGSETLAGGGHVSHLANSVYPPDGRYYLVPVYSI